jgi:hypothetical protein
VVVVENAVSSHLLNGLHGSTWIVTYWRDASEEVGFVVSRGAQDWGLEVKSGRGEWAAALHLRAGVEVAMT